MYKELLKFNNNNLVKKRAKDLNRYPIKGHNIMRIGIGKRVQHQMLPGHQKLRQRETTTPLSEWPKTPAPKTSNADEEEKRHQFLVEMQTGLTTLEDSLED